MFASNRISRDHNNERFDICMCCPIINEMLKLLMSILLRVESNHWKLRNSVTNLTEFLISLEADELNIFINIIGEQHQINLIANLLIFSSTLALSRYGSRQMLSRKFRGEPHKNQIINSLKIIENRRSEAHE